jgi:GT2 family glycosyltransferase
MISVVCVYNNWQVLDRSLLSSLREQTELEKHQLILMDNTKGEWKSAAAALNAGAKQATGKYIMFIHQDVELMGAGWLERAECTLETLPFLGVAGVIGVTVGRGSTRERLRGHIWAGDTIGKPMRVPEEVQTLDEIVAIMPRDKFRGFDEKTFDGWHCYVVDYCLSAIRQGLRVYVIPDPVWHSRNVEVLEGEAGIRQLWKTMRVLRLYLKRLYLKHGDHFKVICTTTNGIGKYGVPLVFLWNPKVFSLGFRLWRSFQRGRVG